MLILLMSTCTFSCVGTHTHKIPIQNHISMFTCDHSKNKNGGRRGGGLDFVSGGGGGGGGGGIDFGGGGGGGSIDFGNRGGSGGLISSFF